MKQENKMKRRNCKLKSFPPEVKNNLFKFSEGTDINGVGDGARTRDNRNHNPQDKQKTP